MLKWLFLAVYLVATGYNIFLLGKKSIKNIVFFAVSVAVTCAVYPFINSLILCILINRVIVVLSVFIDKTLFEKVFCVVSFFAFDFSLLPIEKGDAPWQYVITSFVILYCIAMLTPYPKARRQNMEWLVSKGKLRIVSITLLPLFVIPIPIIIKTVWGTAISFALSGVLILLQHYIISYLKEKELVEVMNKWQAETRDYMNTIRSQRHDFNLHLHAISGLIAGANYEKCNEYIKKLVDEASAINEIMPIYDAVIGSMLSEMRVKAKEKGTSLTYDIKYDMKDVLCNAFECNKIIGNLIQNAIDAVNTDKEKEYGIRVKILKKRGNSVVTVENYSEKDPEDLQKIFNLGYSTKKGHEGLGLAMIEKTLKKYGGKIYVEFKERAIKFVAQIPNKITFDED